MAKKELLEMIEQLKRVGFLHDKSVETALLAVDRALFILETDLPFAYSDRALPLYNNQTISAPTVVSFMLEKLEIKQGMKILEIGTGSGYNAALLAELVGKKGKVISIEIIAELHEFAKANIAKLKKPHPQLTLLCQDGTEGYKKEAPYDRIIVTAYMSEFTTNHSFVKQLKKGGKLIAPVGNSYGQDLILFDNKTKSFQRILPVLFVPLTGKEGIKQE